MYIHVCMYIYIYREREISIYLSLSLSISLSLYLSLYLSLSIHIYIYIHIHYIYIYIYILRKDRVASWDHAWPRQIATNETRSRRVVTAVAWEGCNTCSIKAWVGESARQRQTA